MPEDLTHPAGPSRDGVVQTSAPPVSPPGYELLDEIGRGGMGVVYRARDTALDRDVAVKLLSNRYPPDSPAAQRFLSEARITGQLQHPGIPAVHQVGTFANGRPFLAMKLIKGSTLEALLKQRADPSADRGRLLAIFETVCQAVGYAHAHRVIHRDLKPANVMVGAFGEVQVMDWGLAKSLASREPERPEADPQETQAWSQLSPTPETGSRTEAGSMVGTPAFIPPEQAVGEIERVNERSDVFGLGALLAVILTGQPPYVGETGDAVRVQAVRGKLENCFARLNASGAEPELVALCKQCLAFEPADRPVDAGAVAAAVAGLRAAADERARRAELERVRVKGEQATALAVLAVQRQANVQLEAKNAELAEQQAEVEARFETAQKAIATFHTGVSEDFLLKNAEFKELRTKLLKEAAGFYADLEKLLVGKTDPKSRKLLADGYFQLGELTDKIGDKKDALAVHRKALALRRELAAAPGADGETRLDVARSLQAVASLLANTGDTAAALSAFQEQRDLAEALEAKAPTDAVRTQQAYGHHGIGDVLEQTGNLAAALQAYREAVAIRQKLTDANPAVSAFQSELATSHYNSGVVLYEMGNMAAALQAYQKALAIQQKLADANPAVTDFQRDLATNQIEIGYVLLQMGKPAAALREHQKALAIQQRLADSNPAVTEYQSRLARNRFFIGDVLRQTGKVAEGLREYQEALAIYQKLAGANPTIPDYRSDLARIYYRMGRLLSRQGRLEDALSSLDRGHALCQQLAGAHPETDRYTLRLGYSHAHRGAAHVRAGHPAEAATDLRRAMELLPRSKSWDAEDRFERARALALLAGLAAEGKSGVTTAEAAAFADQAITALRDAVQAGWGQDDELKEPDFDALRKRDDFQKLVKELSPKAAGGDQPNPEKRSAPPG
jgi:tetratricopeptide (TPR) repeat protein